MSNLVRFQVFQATRTISSTALFPSTHSITSRYSCASRTLRASSHYRLNRPRLSSTAAISPATLEGAEKNYTPKITKLVNEISQLTLLEVADLNELLKKSLNISDAPMMMSMGAGGAMANSAKAQEEEEAPEAKVEKTLFTVRLTKYDETKKVALIKEVKTIVAGMNLVQAKKFVESLPQSVKTDVSKEEAEKLKLALTAVGATVDIE